MLDRDELELPFDGLTIFRDIEGTEELFAEPWAFRKAYQKAMETFSTSRARMRRPRLRPRAVLHRRATGPSLSYFLHCRRNRPGASAGHAILNDVHILSPLLIWGTLLGAIPIIIHLLNRRRFRRVEWAPMHYLQLTIQRNRRRIQFEQLLLLLLADRAARAAVLLPRRPAVEPDGPRDAGWVPAAGPARSS